MGYKDYFKDKKVTLMRIGLLGRGVGDAAFLAKCGAQILVVDDAPKKIMQPSVRKLKKYKNIKFRFGKYDLNDFRNCDMVLKGAGAPLDSPEIAEAKKYGIPVEMSASLFARLADIPIIGVTGTRGKSTVTHLINHILKTAKKKVLIGGNVVGVSTLALLPKTKKADYALFELDSWQLQGFGDNKISPNISVFTTFLSDHMNYYKNSMEKYFLDKINIFKYQKRGDVSIIGKQVEPILEEWFASTRSFGRDELPNKPIIAPELIKGFPSKLLGTHNAYNIALAITTARLLGIKDVVIKKGIKSFKGVPGRMELVRNFRGIKYYNDTTATTPDAAVAALKAISKKRNIILIMGGADKGLDMTHLINEIPNYCKDAVLLKGNGTEKIRKMIYDLGFKIYECKGMKEAVKSARQLARRGDIVLLSPAFASFGMFKNEFDRGNQFMKLVKKLK